MKPPSRKCNQTAVCRRLDGGSGSHMYKKILVVEDEHEHRHLICYNLRQAGFSVATAKDGIEALKKARSLLPDLILLDLKLPELDGFSVCETLRHDAATASIPIVML